MSSRVYEAIATRWSSQSLDDTFLGGLFFGRAVSDVEFPYVVLLSLGNAVDSWTSSSEFRIQKVQFSIFYRQKEYDSDPVSKVGSLMRTLDAAYSFAPLSIPESSGHVLEMRRVRDDIRIDPHMEEVWHGVIDYDILRRLPVDYSPS